MPAAQQIGEPAPEVKLPDLQGTTVELKDFRGQKTLVLFWNPGCGFCQQMLPEIREWEENRPEGAPKLLFVSAGTEEANRDMKLSSKVVLDQQFAAGRSFGASGTPSAVLVDAEGNVASGVAVGAPGVLELAGAHQAEA
jgi:peroxiredoxin